MGASRPRVSSSAFQIAIAAGVQYGARWPQPYRLCQRAHRDFAQMLVILGGIDFAIQQSLKLAVELDIGRGTRVGRDLALGEYLEQHGRQRITHDAGVADVGRSEEHTSELQSLMRISYAVFCLKKKSTSIYRTQSTTHV